MNGRGARGSTKLLGRSAECRTLERLLDDARGGSSSVLVVRGEPGIGKTALLDFASERAVGMQVVAISGIESETGFAFAALQRLLTPSIHSAASLQAAQRRALAAAFGARVLSDQDAFLVGLATLSLLSRRSGQQPLICIVDDAHWLDRQSAAVLGFVARRLDREGVVLLVAAREPAHLPELAWSRELRLDRLGDDDALRLIEGAVAGPLADHVRRRVLAETVGNPLALLEVARALTADHLAGRSALPDPLPVLPAVGEELAEGVRRLPVRTQELLLLLAAEVFDTLLFCRAGSRLGIGDAAADAAVAAGVLRVWPRLEFIHPLMRSAVYACSLPSDRRRVHSALADSAEDVTGDPDRRAWHRAAAAQGPDEEVAAALEAAAGPAQKRQGYAAAATLLVRSAELTPEHSRRSERLLAAAAAELAAGASSRATALLAEAQHWLPDGLPRAEARRLQGLLALASGENMGATDALLDAALAFEGFDVRRARDTHLEALEAAVWGGRLSGQTALRTAVRSAPRVPVNEVTVADLLLDGLMTLAADGHAKSVPMLRAAIAAGRDAEDERWVGLAGHVAIELWEDEAYCTLTRRRVALARRAGALTALPNALSQLAGYEVIVGRLDDAEACLAEGQMISSATGNPGLTGRADLGGLAVAAWRGDALEVAKRAQLCTRDAKARGLGAFINFVDYSIAVFENGRGHYRAALVAAVAATDDDVLRVTNQALPELVEACVRCGEFALAVAATRRLAEAVEPCGTPWGSGLLSRCRALIATGPAAEELYQESIEQLQRCRVTPQLARSRLVYGEWLRRERRRRDAREQLQAADAMFASMGALEFKRRANVEVSATVEHVSLHAVGFAKLLTAQELRIAELVSDGASNSDIAAKLYISTRTVEYHLHKIFRKLRITRRTQLAKALLTGSSGSALVKPLA